MWYNSRRKSRAISCESSDRAELCRRQALRYAIPTRSATAWEPFRLKCSGQMNCPYANSTLRAEFNRANRRGSGFAVFDARFAQSIFGDVHAAAENDLTLFRARGAKLCEAEAGNFRNGQSRTARTARAPTYSSPDILQPSLAIFALRILPDIELIRMRKRLRRSTRAPRCTMSGRRRKAPFGARRTLRG